MDNYIEFKVTKEILEAIDNDNLFLSYEIKNNKGKNIEVIGDICTPFLHNKITGENIELNIKEIKKESKSNL